MTINKMQGQIFLKVGLDLPKTVLGHDQVYLALSKGTTEEGVMVNFQETEEQYFHNGMAFTQNLMNPEIIPLSNYLFSCTRQTQKL